MRADARRNRERILLAARDVIVEQGPDAPLEEIAARAGVGIGTLYRRFPERRALLRAVAFDALERSADEAQRALAEEVDAFAALSRYMRRILALRIGAVMPTIAERMPLDDEEMFRAREASTAPIHLLIDRAQAAGQLRADVTFSDISLLLVRLSRPVPGPLPAELNERLARRHLTLLLDALRAADERRTPLPEPALSLAELRAAGEAASANPDRGNQK